MPRLMRRAPRLDARLTAHSAWFTVAWNPPPTRRRLRSAVDPGPAAPPPRSRLRRLVFGAPRDVQDPRTHHHISLVALLAWVGLGADGLSSSAYGPDEAFRALGQPRLPRGRAGPRHGRHRPRHLRRLLADHQALPVRRRRLRRRDRAARSRAPASSPGSALVVDYVLTISVSIASCGDAIFSFLPHGAGPVEAARRGGRHRLPGDPEPARREGVGLLPGPDLRPLRGHPRRS